MRRLSRKFKLLITMTLSILTLAIVYFIVLPEHTAAQYISRVKNAAESLEPGYFRLEESTGRTLISDPTTQSVDVTHEVESLRDLLRENRVGLAHFMAIAKDHEPLPYTGFTDTARSAIVLQNKAVAFAEQSDQAFTQYSNLVDFIKHYDTTAKAVGQYTEEFNATPDLNVYAGQQDRFYAIGEQIRTIAQTFESTPTPHEAATFKAASVQSFQQLANGFDAVGLGLQIPADDAIYGGAREIEAADRMINEVNQVIYARDILSSRTIKSVQELREKIELIAI